MESTEIRAIKGESGAIWLSYEDLILAYDRTIEEYTASARQAFHDNNLVAVLQFGNFADAIKAEKADLIDTVESGIV